MLQILQFRIAVSVSREDLASKGEELRAGLGVRLLRFDTFRSWGLCVGFVGISSRGVFTRKFIRLTRINFQTT